MIPEVENKLCEILLVMSEQLLELKKDILIQNSFGYCLLILIIVLNIIDGRDREKKLEELIGKKNDNKS